MLVLTRKTGETIRIDDDITIQIVQVRGRQVRVGIEAPKNKKVQRGELLQPLAKVKDPVLLRKEALSKTV